MAWTASQMLSNINLQFVVFKYSWQEMLLPERLQEADAKGGSNTEECSAYYSNEFPLENILRCFSLNINFRNKTHLSFKLEEEIASQGRNSNDWPAR